jgi:FkbM family methyltransferase
MSIPSMFWNMPHNLIAAMGFGGRKPRTIERLDDLMVARFADGRALYYVTARRNRLYGFGYDERLARVATRYGAGVHFNPEPGQVVLDVGANVGEFSLFAALKGAEVISIEPDRRNMKALTLNTQHLANIRRLQLACADNDGETIFYAYPEGADSSLIEPEKYSDKYKVATRRLDALMAELGRTRIDLMKCDAEGAEPEVLRGAAGILPLVKTLVLDVSPERNGASTADACAAIVRAAGMKVEFFHKGRILVAKQG